MADSICEPGQVLNNRYRIERLLGKGGMGQVFLAYDLSTAESVALKTFRALDDDSDRRRFEREIRTLQVLSHPNIVPLRDVGWAGETLFYTMEYLPGITLEEVIFAQKDLPKEKTLAWYLRVCIQICEALGYLHNRHIVHRDIKPANILLRTTLPAGTPLPAAGDWVQHSQVKACVTDFGLVKTRASDGSLTQTAIGTPQYMAPEQIEASPAVDERSDLYSVGVILHRILTGRLPFQRLSEALSRRPLPPMQEANPDVPATLQELVRRLLEFEPYRRPANAEEVMELLQATLERKGESAVGAPAPSKLSQPFFCGRALELQRLKGAARAVARGRGHWVSINGERGTGKTWLVARSEFKSHVLVEERMAFYVGTFAMKRPHSGFQDVLISVLKHIERHEGTERIPAILGRWGRLLRTPFPELDKHGWISACPPVEEDVPQEILNERIFETVVGALTANAEVEARVLVLEDVHNGDDFDLELLHRLIISALALPVLVVTTRRPEGERRLRLLERLHNEIRSERELTEIDLRPFVEDETRAMVASLLAPLARLADPFASVLQERTEGVPLYLLHLVNSLWNRDLIRLIAGGWQADPEAVRALPVPETTRSYFLLVLDELPAQDLRVLNLAAVLGPRFSFDVLQLVLDMDEFELDQTCRNLVHAGIFVEHQDGFRFPHSLEHEIVLSRLSRPLFRRLHARVGKVLEESYANDLEKHLAEIAEHMYLGGEQEKGLEYLRRAARKAEQAYAPRTALEYYQKALTLTQEPKTRRSLLSVIGDLHARLGEPDLALSHFREAILHFTSIEQALLDGSTLGEEERGALVDYTQLLIKFGEVYLRQSDYAPALENFEKSERISRFIGRREGIAYSLVRQGGAHFSMEDPQRAEQTFLAAVELYQTQPPEGGLVAALTGLGLVEKMRGRFEKSIEYTTRALEIAQEIRDSMQTAGLLNNFGILYRSLGRLREAITSFERSIEIRERLGDRQGLARCFMNLGRAQMFLGDFRRGLEALTRSRELFHAIGDKKGILLTLGNLGTLQYYFGDFNQATSIFTQYLQDSRRLKLLRGEADALSSLGIVELETERYEQAEHHFAESLRCFEQAGDHEGVVRNRVQLARVRGRQGHLSETLRICEEVRSRAGSKEFPEAVAQALRVEAEAYRRSGELEKARERGEEALAAFEQQTLPFDQGTCCRTLGKTYRDMGFYWADQAGKYFERALRIFSMLGARHAEAITQLEYGIFLGLVEEGERARELFGKARQVFVELGTQTELVRVERELKEMK